MDSQTAEEVVPVQPEKTWTDAIRATLMPRDHGVSDEEICELLEAVANGEPLAPLLAARNISLPVYCVWKAKYRQMSLEQVRAARSRERWRARGVVAGLLLIAMVGGSGIVFGLARAAQSQLTGAKEAVSAGAAAGSSTSPAPASNEPLAAAEPTSRPDVPHTDSSPPPDKQRGSSAQNQTTAVAEAKPSADAPSVIGEPGYKIQVAAANTEEEGRAIVERLAQAGYRAYLLGATVNSAEVFRVRIGPFDTLESAQELFARLRQDGYSDAWVVR